MMEEIFKSASKIVFILMAVFSCIGFSVGLLEPEQFMLLAGMAFSFYFANKGNTDEAYLGK